MQNNYYIYFHINPLKNNIFYVGKGIGNRAYSKTSRNKYWKNTVAKYGYIIDIVETNLSEEESFNKEIFYINFIGRDNLVNMTNGGEGASGRKVDDITKDKMRQKAIGRKGHLLYHTYESRLKMSKSHTGKILTKEHIENVIKSQNKPIDQLDLNDVYIKSFESIKLAKEETGIKNIQQVCSGRCKTAGGFKFKYKNKEVICTYN